MSNGSTELITWRITVDHPEHGGADPDLRPVDRPVVETGKRVDMFPLREENGFALDVDEYVRFIRAAAPG